MSKVAIKRQIIYKQNAFEHLIEDKKHQLMSISNRGLLEEKLTHSISQQQLQQVLSLNIMRCETDSAAYCLPLKSSRLNQLHQVGCLVYHRKFRSFHVQIIVKFSAHSYHSIR